MSKPTNPVTTHRPLSTEEAEALRQAIYLTPNITGYTRNELKSFTDVFIVTIDDKIAGVCISKGLLCKWTEIAVLYVFEDYRQQGIGTILFEKAWIQATTRERHIYTVSKNPSVIRMMTAHGMNIGKIFSLPFAVHLHNLIFIMKPYRIEEFFRKRKMSKNSPDFKYGTKL